MYWVVKIYFYVSCRRERKMTSLPACQGFRLYLWQVLALWGLPVCLRVIPHHHSVCLSAGLSLPLSRHSFKLSNVGSTEPPFPRQQASEWHHYFWKQIVFDVKGVLPFCVVLLNIISLNGQFVSRSYSHALCPVGFSFLIAILVLRITIYLTSRDKSWCVDSGVLQQSI